MKLCTDTVTIYNRYIDAETHSKKLMKRVVRGVHWWGKVHTTATHNGLYSADEYTMRVPIEADFSPYTYVSPKTFEHAEDKSNLVTFAIGDVMVYGETDDGEYTQSELQDKFDDVRIIISVTDNRRAPNAPHWKVVGR